MEDLMVQYTPEVFGVKDLFSGIRFWLLFRNDWKIRIGVNAFPRDLP
jgi:hypothetical protein